MKKYTFVEMQLLNFILWSAEGRAIFKLEKFLDPMVNIYAEYTKNFINMMGHITIDDEKFLEELFN